MSARSTISMSPPTSGSTSCRCVPSPSPAASCTTGGTARTLRIRGGCNRSCEERFAFPAVLALLALVIDYQQLFGSKMILGNLEVRFPPLGLLGIGQGLFGFLPIEMVLFGDAGLAWCSDVAWECSNIPADDARPFFLGGNRTPVYSAGAGLRMNLFGFMIIELDWVYPFSRERGGHFQFSFLPGF